MPLNANQKYRKQKMRKKSTTRVGVFGDRKGKGAAEEN